MKRTQPQRGAALFATLLGTIAVAPSAFAQQAELKSLGTVIDAAQCINCHSTDGVASDTRLVFPADDASDQAIAEFSEWLLELVDPDAPEDSRLYRKATERMRHGGGERVQRGTRDETNFLKWVQALASGQSNGQQVLAFVKRPVAEKGGRVLRRLSAVQYDNTVRALLGDATGVGRSLPPEDFVDGFSNQHLGQSASPARIEAFSTAAETLANNAIIEIGLGDAHGLLACDVQVASPTRRLQKPVETTS